MGFRSFRLNVALRVAALVVLSLLMIWGWRVAGWRVTPFVCGALLLLVAGELIRYVERGARELTGFLTFVAHQDFATPISVPYKGRVFTGLEEAYALLTDEFRRLNREKAAKHQYLEAVIEHVGVALVCFDDRGDVTMLNETARRLFGVPHLNSVQSFAPIDPELPATLRQLGDGDRTLISLRRDEEPLQIVAFATRFDLLQQQYKLVSFQNIRDELDRHEIDSWQRLIRVLTHEIMNSVTPILSLSGVIRETLVDESATGRFRDLAEPDREDVIRSLDAIHARSTGLLDFVQAYRSLTNVPAPVIADVDVALLLQRVATLMAGEMEERGITGLVSVEPRGLAIRADAGQIEQVLINLVRNAMDALAQTASPRIELRAVRDEEGRALIHVADNGPGIEPGHRDSIFVPFFTTRKHGTGVGLSISRQLTHANRGLIAVRPGPDGGSVFTLRFRAA